MRASRPAFRYHGSKFMLSAWIIGHFPVHECYVEPFGGGASVLLQKHRSWLEVYNDADGEVVNFFRILREQADELIHKIDLTPYAKEEWELSLEQTDDLLERARRFYVRSYMNMAGPTAQWRSGWRRQKVITKDLNGSKKMTPAAISFVKTEHLYVISDRLRGVQIENDDYTGIIDRYDSAETLFYLDPPYVAETRGRWKTTAYRFEMTDEQHCELADQLRGIHGMAIISGYKSDLYDELFSDWRQVSISARVNGPGSNEEVLWLNPSASEMLRVPTQGVLL